MRPRMICLETLWVGHHKPCRIRSASADTESDCEAPRNRKVGAKGLAQSGSLAVKLGWGRELVHEPQGDPVTFALNSSQGWRSGRPIRRASGRLVWLFSDTPLDFQHLPQLLRKKCSPGASRRFTSTSHYAETGLFLNAELAPPQLEDVDEKLIFFFFVA